MTTANDVASVIAGEATYGTPQERWNDMVAIASSIVNRARELGVTPQEVISAVDKNGYAQYNAYGKDLPPGVDQGIVDMAQKAMDYVQDYGPTHPGSFYATPNAVDGLPSGLNIETSTSGHKFYSDPANRNILTAAGFQTPSGEEPSRLMTPFDNSPSAAFDRYFGQQPNLEVAPASQSILTPFNNIYNAALEPGQQAIQNLLSQSQTPTPVEDVGDESGLFGPADLADINAKPTGYNRPYTPQQSVIDNIQGAVTSVLGPDANVQVTSGTEGGLAQFGSNRHKTGLAADITITDANGHKLSLSNPADVQAMKDIAQSAATQQANIGLGYANSPSMMHVDYVPAADLSAGQDQSWGRIGNDPEFAGLLADARTYGTMPASFYEKANERVIANNVVPTANPVTDPQISAVGGLNSVLNPVTPTAVQVADLPSNSLGSFPSALAAQREVALATPPDLSSLADGIAAQRGDLVGVNSAEMDAMKGRIAYNVLKGNVAPPVEMASLTPAVSAVEEKAPVPSYAEAIQNANLPAQPVSLETAMALQTPAFNQALAPTVPSLYSPTIGLSDYQAQEAAQMAQVPGVIAAANQPAQAPALETVSIADQPAISSAPVTIPGPATTPVDVQQQQAAVTDTAPATTTATRTTPAQPAQSKGLLSGLLSKETAIGGALGGLAFGPAGGLLGALAGQQVARAGGLASLFGGQPISINNIGTGPAAAYSVWGGAPVGTQATASDGQTITAGPGGLTVVTNANGVSTGFDSTGKGYSVFGGMFDQDQDAAATT